MKAIDGLTERHVQAIWYDRNLRPQHLYTRLGSEVTVISPGEWNLAGGPDFRNAVLEVGRDRTRVVGDVEVHLCPRDWDFHRHGADPAYRNVVAHVTWGCGPIPQSLPTRAISIWLGRFVTDDPSFSPMQIDLSAYPFARLPMAEPPCAERFSRDPDLARTVLAAAGRHRLRMKARRLAGRLCERIGARRQTFYEEVMGALGYSNNAEPFRRVAVRVPIDDLPRNGSVARSALLVAGSFENWNRRTVRPNNSPEHRLMDAARIFTETPIMEFSECADFSESACRRLVAAMCVGHCMGRGRAGAVLTNIIVPFALAEGRISEIPDWLPTEDISTAARRTAFRLFGLDHNPSAFYARNGLMMQGLLQIERDWCRKDYPNCVVSPMADASKNSPPR